MIDLKGVMEDLLEQEREGSLPPSEKATAQTLLLTISVKSKLFNQHQMDTAKKLLHKLEGDRRRKCRTVHTESDIDANTPASPAHKELLIVRDKKKRRSRGPEQNKASDTENDEGDESDDDDEKEQAKTTPQQSAGLLDGDGFKKHSDDEGDWSDVDEGELFVIGIYYLFPSLLTNHRFSFLLFRTVQECAQKVNHSERDHKEKTMGSW